MSEVMDTPMEDGPEDEMFVGPRIIDKSSSLVDNDPGVWDNHNVSTPRARVSEAFKLNLSVDTDIQPIGPVINGTKRKRETQATLASSQRQMIQDETVSLKEEVTKAIEAHGAELRTFWNEYIAAAGADINKRLSEDYAAMMKNWNAIVSDGSSEGGAQFRQLIGAIVDAQIKQHQRAAAQHTGPRLEATSLCEKTVVQTSPPSAQVFCLTPRREVQAASQPTELATPQQPSLDTTLAESMQAVLGDPVRGRHVRSVIHSAAVDKVNAWIQAFDIDTVVQSAVDEKVNAWIEAFGINSVVHTAAAETVDAKLSPEVLKVLVEGWMREAMQSVSAEAAEVVTAAVMKAFQAEEPRLLLKQVVSDEAKGQMVALDERNDAAIKTAVTDAVVANNSKLRDVMNQIANDVTQAEMSQYNVRQFGMDHRLQQLEGLEPRVRGHLNACLVKSEAKNQALVEGLRQELAQRHATQEEVERLKKCTQSQFEGIKQVIAECLASREDVQKLEAEMQSRFEGLLQETAKCHATSEDVKKLEDVIQSRVEELKHDVIRRHTTHKDVDKLEKGMRSGLDKLEQEISTGWSANKEDLETFRIEVLGTLDEFNTRQQEIDGRYATKEDVQTLRQELLEKLGTLDDRLEQEKANREAVAKADFDTLRIEMLKKLEAITSDHQQEMASRHATKSDFELLRDEMRAMNKKMQSMKDEMRRKDEELRTRPYVTRGDLDTLRLDTIDTLGTMDQKVEQCLRVMQGSRSYPVEL
ncbi:hypothetical protein B0H63DRAFT_565701 [Podospora didyma]|uniref:Uncharacterized protein n=1 Tax=Podospora didyma TaxID=330526 RepID=A0AAE0K0H4_9PEZI|nr:hypothetical protein B0H63DRAFT_565701 [Podospora didyma]